LYTREFNYFPPQQHLRSKERNGARIGKRYDAPQTPADRLLASGLLDGDQAQKLEEDRARINPVQLTRDIDRALHQLWDLAVYPPYGAAARPSSTRDAG